MLEGKKYVSFNTWGNVACKLVWSLMKNNLPLCSECHTNSFLLLYYSVWRHILKYNQIHIWSEYGISQYKFNVNKSTLNGQQSGDLQLVYIHTKQCVESLNHVLQRISDNMQKCSQSVKREIKHNTKWDKKGTITVIVSNVKLVSYCTIKLLNHSCCIII